MKTQIKHPFNSKQSKTHTNHTELKLNKAKNSLYAYKVKIYATVIRRKK
jgi:hypothetical protein